MCQTVDGSEIRRSPVDKEFISLSPLFTRFLYMLGGDRRISEPSTVCFVVFFLAFFPRRILYRDKP